MKSTEITTALAAHVAWLANPETGSRAILSGVDLRRIDLCKADLTGADLSGADLRDVDLRGADLHRANLSGADLRGADLSRADLTGADLRGADLRGADLHNAFLFEANMSNANLTDSITFKLPEPEMARARLAEIATIVLADPHRLEMTSWHTCKTTHCLIGHAITLAGAEGTRLEAMVGPHTAGRILLGDEAARLLYSSNNTVLNWLTQYTKPA